MRRESERSVRDGEGVRGEGWDWRMLRMFVANNRHTLLSSLVSVPCFMW